MDIEKLEAIVEAQKQIVANNRKAEQELGRPTGLDTRLVIVCDDIMYKKGVTRSEIFAQISLNGRHFNIVLLLSSQYLMIVDITLRSNIDYLICLRETIPKNRIKIYDNYFGMFAKRQDFFTVLDNCTRNYEALVLDNTEPNASAENCVFFYKAMYPSPEFMFGSKSFRKASNTNC
jgi:hypothetical protein